MILTLLVFMSGCGSDGGKNYPRFLVAGQSNSVAPANGAAPTWPRNGLVTINDYYHDRYQFRIPTQADPNDSGYTWIDLGDLMGEPVFFNLVGNGGTSSRQWVDTYDENILKALAVTPYTAVLWVQGESDRGLGISAEESYSNLKTVIERSRAVQPGLPWYVALDGGSVDGGPARTAQLRLIQEGIALAGPDIDELRKDHSNFEADLSEFQGPGFQRHAQAWFQILRAM